MMSMMEKIDDRKQDDTLIANWKQKVNLAVK